MDKELRSRLAATATSDPADYSWSSSESRWRSFVYALTGIAWMLRFQANTRIMGAATVAVLIAGWQADIDALRWAVSDSRGSTGLDRRVHQRGD